MNNIVEGNRQKVKDGCRKANHANMILHANKAKENEPSSLMTDLENFKTSR